MPLSMAIDARRSSDDGTSTHLSTSTIHHFLAAIALAVLKDSVPEKKQAMFILASLPESFQMMVTAVDCKLGRHTFTSRCDKEAQK